LSQPPSPARLSALLEELRRATEEIREAAGASETGRLGPLVARRGALIEEFGRLAGREPGSLRGFEQVLVSIERGGQESVEALRALREEIRSAVEAAESFEAAARRYGAGEAGRAGLDRSA